MWDDDELHFVLDQHTTVEDIYLVQIDFHDFVFTFSHAFFITRYYNLVFHHARWGYIYFCTCFSNQSVNVLIFWSTYEGVKHFWHWYSLKC